MRHSDESGISVNAACDSQEHTQRDLPALSVIIPCRNEEQFIRQCLDSVIASDYPRDRWEMVVVDGMSNDRTRQILDEYRHKFPTIRVLDNPATTTPAALNIAIENSGGDIVIRMDAHARIERDYIRRCAACLEAYDTDNVGGVIRTLPQTDGLFGRAIAFSLSHRFGVGNSYFRINARDPRWVDTVFGGCYRKSVFQRLGGFNESLVRGQDMEFNLRLKKAGGRILLVPNIVSNYYARSDLRSFWKHNWTNGVWAIVPFMHSAVMPVSWRHLVPLLCVISVVSGCCLSVIMPRLLWAVVGVVSVYASAGFVVAGQIALRERDVRYVFVLPLAFWSLHIGYGMGSLWGLIKLLVSRKFWSKKILRSRREYEPSR